MNRRKLAIGLLVLALVVAAVAVGVWLATRENIRDIPWTGDAIVIRGGTDQTTTTAGG